MNYRHAYHAGNPADVVKHLLVVLLVEALTRKPKSIAVLDAFAGLGDYDLTAEAPQRTREFEAGIARLLAAADPPAGAAAYLAAVRRANPGGGLAIYPGSPVLVRDLLRPGDRLICVEKHPDDVAVLRRRFAGDAAVSVHHRDGYEALKALLPPAERRGLVLVDPPYEVNDEFARAVRALEAANRRWPTGVYAVWYPIKLRAPVDAFLGDLAAAGLRRIAVAEFLWARPDDPGRLSGCGLVVINPPYGWDEAARAALERLGPVLSGAGGEEGAAASVAWLVGE
ncbi:MAG: 23S rRNA (adenine(2030)-N(6))-methyltransferase RlmJ [Azospirillaceae bacterium]